MTTRITTGKIFFFFVGLFSFLASPLLGIHGEVNIVTITPNEFLDNALDANSVLGVSMALQSGADVNKKNGRNCLPLCVAAAHCDKEILELLVKAGADINAVDAKSTPLCEAVYGLREDNVNFLLEQGADINGMTCEGLTPFRLALKCVIALDKQGDLHGAGCAFRLALLLMQQGAEEASLLRVLMASGVYDSTLS